MKAKWEKYLPLKIFNFFQNEKKFRWSWQDAKSWILKCAEFAIKVLKNFFGNLKCNFLKIHVPWTVGHEDSNFVKSVINEPWLYWFRWNYIRKQYECINEVGSTDYFQLFTYYKCYCHDNLLKVFRSIQCMIHTVWPAYRNIFEVSDCEFAITVSFAKFTFWCLGATIVILERC